MKRILSFVIAVAIVAGMITSFSKLSNVSAEQATKKYNCYVDGKKYYDLSAYASYQTNGRWMVQARLIAQILGLDVGYDNKTKIVSLIQPEGDSCSRRGLSFVNGLTIATFSKYFGTGTVEEFDIMKTAPIIGQDNKMYLDFQFVVEKLSGKYYVNPMDGQFQTGIYVYTRHFIEIKGQKQYVEASEEAYPISEDKNIFGNKVQHGAIWVPNNGAYETRTRRDGKEDYTTFSVKSVAFLNDKELAFLIYELFDEKGSAKNKFADSVKSGAAQEICGEALTSAIVFMAGLEAWPATFVGIGIGTIINVVTGDGSTVPAEKTMNLVKNQIDRNDNMGFAKIELLETRRHFVVRDDIHYYYYSEDQYSYDLKIEYLPDTGVFKNGNKAFDSGYPNNQGYWLDLITAKTSDELIKKYAKRLQTVTRLAPAPKTITRQIDSVIENVPAPSDKTSQANTTVPSNETSSQGSADTVIVSSSQESSGSTSGKASQEIVPQPAQQPVPQSTLTFLGSYPTNLQGDVDASTYVSLNFDQELEMGDNFDNIMMTDKNGQKINSQVVIFPYDSKELCIYHHSTPFNQGDTITVYLPANAVKNRDGSSFNKELWFSFNTEGANEFPKLSSSGVDNENSGTVDFSGSITIGPNWDNVYILTENSEIIRVNTTIRDWSVVFDISTLQKDKRYYYYIGIGALSGTSGITNSREFRLEFNP